MPTTSSPEFIKLLASDLRWSLLKALAGGDYRVQELVEQVSEPMNLVSYHLKKMRDDRLLTTRRSEADGRDIYYSLDLAQLHTRFAAAGGALHPALAAASTASGLPANVTPRVLFVCTHNSARSQMAEALMRHLSGQRVDVYSAGSSPTTLHPDAIVTLDALGLDIRHQRAKDLSEFDGQRFDYVITVCDRAREICPAFPGSGQAIHWGFSDPTRIRDDGQRRQAFTEIATGLQVRIVYFLAELSAPPGNPI